MAWVERYCTTTGAGAHDGTSEGNAWDLGEAITNASAGHRVNVKAGTYANTTTSRNFAGDGTTGSPIWWRGYKTTIGDQDAPTATRVSGTDTPKLTFTSGVVTISGDYNFFSHIDFEGSAPGQRLIGVSGPHCRMDLCKVVCTENSGTSYALRASGNGGIFTQCTFDALATFAAIIEERILVNGCLFTGAGLYADHSVGWRVVGCTFDDVTGNGIQIGSYGGGIWFIDRCNFYSCSSDGIEIGGTAPAAAAIINCIFDQNGAYGINNAIGSATGNIMLAGNAFYNNSSGQMNAMGETFQPAITLSGSPFVDAAGGDFTLNTDSGEGAACRDAGFTQWVGAPQ